MLCARVLRRLSVAFVGLVAMCKGFKGNVSPCHYVQGFYTKVAPCVAMCKGFKGNVQLLPLCERVLWKCDAMCGYVQGFLRKCSDLVQMKPSETK